MISPKRILAAAAALLLAASPAAAADRLMAFYVPWDAASLDDLKAHAAEIDTLAPVWLSIAGPDHELRVAPDPEGRAAIAALPSQSRLLLTVQNSADGSWQGGDADALLADRDASKRLIAALMVQVRVTHADGVVIDFERLSDRGVQDLVRFVRTARKRLGHVEVAVPVGNAGWDLAALASVADGLVLMTYDQHWTTGEPGPIAGTDWYAKMLAQLPDAIKHHKLAAGVAGYAYDWPGDGAAKTMSVAAAEQLAADRRVSVVVDGPSGNSHFAYDAKEGRHTVWIVPADAMRAEMSQARAAGIGRVALWRLGAEDSAFWATRHAAPQ